MSFRNRLLIKGPTGSGRHCRVGVDRELHEYRVRLFVDGQSVPAADYYTDDLVDAIKTAEAMSKPIGPRWNVEGQIAEFRREQIVGQWVQALGKFHGLRLARRWFACDHERDLDEYLYWLNRLEALTEEMRHS